MKWSDEVTDSVRTITVIDDIELTSVFEVDNSTAIEDINSKNISIRLTGNRLTVEGADDYAVYAISGQSLGKVESLERGVYVVVADGESKKIVVK